ncbi:small subunit processome component 20 homolog [Coccinella septempunctata]|uniref:small subunit processome component 20 homolog n=1 Tax=Coccinella septempunctata TaxID=41139 RepID=UPI001D0835C0|nr:small subunit processome component 20 homolog [Coccinella septempunctata]
MKSKSGRHKDENTFKFRTFSERISAINVDVIHRVKHVNEKTSEEISYFYQDFEKWDVLNITEGYTSFKKEIKINLLVTLPQIIAHKEHIVNTLLKYLKHKNPLYLQPLLSLTASLASDLRENFYEHYHDFYDILIELLETKDTEQLEWVFQCLAYFFHKLWKCLVKDFKKIFLSLLPLLSESKAEYINNFAAESFTFVTRKVKDRKYLLDLILKTVNRKKDGIRGCGRLFFEVIKGVNGQLHSCAGEFLQLLFESLPEYENFLIEILEYTIAHITDYVSPQKSEIFWSCILTALSKSRENWNELKDENNLRSIEHLLKLLGQAIEHKHGKIVHNLNRIIQEIVPILSMEILPEHVVVTLVKVVIVILLSDNLRLTQEEAVLLVKNTLAVKNETAKLYFVDNITEFSCFKPMVLPHFLKSCAEKNFEKNYLRTLTNVILKKAPLANDGIKLRSWSKYPLNIKSNENSQEIELSLLNVIEEGLDKERLFCTLVCIPHLSLKDIEKFKQIIGTQILKLLEKCAKDEKEKFFFLNLHIECLLHLNNNDFFKENFQKIMNVLLPLVDEKSILGILKIMSLVILAVENQEFINIETLKFLNEYFEPYFCSPFHEIRLLTTFIYTLFEDIPEFDLVHSTDPDSIKEKFEVFTICHSIESIDPQISTYHSQIRSLEKLSFEKPQMLMCHQTDFKAIPLRYICGVLYMNFQLLWQHTLNIVETHAHGLNISCFWNVYGEQLRRVDEYVLNGFSLTIDEMECEYSTLKLFYENWQKSDSKPDFANYRLLLWKGLSTFPDIGEAKTKDISSLLLKFYEKEFTKYNAELAYTWNIKQKDPESEEALDPEDDAENEEHTVKPVANKAAKVNGKTKLRTFLQYLSVFSKVKSPQSMYREVELYKLYYDLLQHKNSQIQKAALDCLLTYKKKFIVPYKENLYNLIDDKGFKNELATFNLDREGSTVVEEHRDDLMEVVLRIVYSKMNAKIGMRTGGKSAGQHRRTLVLRFLGGCHEREKLIFIRMIFKFFDRYLTEDLNDLTENVDLEHFIPPKRLQSSMNMLNVILEQFGDSLACELLDNLLHYIFVIGSFIKGAFKQISNVHIGYQSALRILRTGATKLVCSFFQKFQQYGWNSKQIDNIFDIFIWPYLDKLNTEGIHSPTALLKLFVLWGSDPKYFPLLVKHRNDDKTEYILPKIMELLVNEKSQHSVVQAIMEMVQHLLIYVEEENKPSLPITNILDINQSIIDRIKINDKLNYGSCILLPHVPSVLLRIQKSLEKKNKNLSRLEIFILSRISELVWEADISEYTLKLLLPVVLKKCHVNISEDIVNQYLITIKNLLQNVDDSTKFLEKISLLFGEVGCTSGRKRLQEIIQVMVHKSDDPELVLLKNIIEELNAYNARWLDQPDFERRHNAFKTIHSLLEKDEINLRLGVLLIFNSYYFLSTESDLSIKENSSHLLKTLCPYLLKKYQKSRKENDYLLETMFNLIRRGMKNKNEDIRNECISLLGHMARKCPENHFILRDLHLFTNENDIEVDFFENLIHLQIHRHGRAMTKLCQILKELDVMINVQTLTRFILPLVSHYLMNEKYASRHTLIDTAIETIGVLCRILPWHHYEGLLKFYLSKLRSRIVHQKQLVRLTVVVLNSFHFDLSKAHSNADIEKRQSENDISKHNEEETKPDDKEATEIGEATVEEDIGEVLESLEVDEEGEDDNDEIPEEKSVKICEKINVLCKSTATRVVYTIRTVLLPQLHRALAEMTHNDSSHKINRKLTRNEQEEDDLIKVPLSLAVVKLLQKLPPKILERNLPGIFMKTCTFLKSHLESVRKVARETLQEMMLTLGPSYLGALLGEMAPLLQKGYQAHVLVYTVHGVLNCLKPHYKPKDIDVILLTVLKLCNTDLFGILSEEKEVAKIIVKTSEAKSSKSLSIYQILAQFITEKCFLDLVLPIKNILESSTSFKTVFKAQECLNSMAIGLVDNQFVSPESLMMFAFGIASEKITQLIPGKNKQELTEKEKLLLQMQKPDCFIIPKAPVGRAGVRVSNVKNSDKANAHHLVYFGLTLCCKLLKKDVLVKQDHLSFLDPFVELFKDCLKSKHIKLSTVTLKCLTFIFKWELPSLKKHIKEITSDIFSILHKYAVAGLSKGENFDLVVVSFKAMSVLLRDVKYHIIDQDQLKILLCYVEKDMYDYDRQAVAFNLLKAILIRKLIVSELSEIMEKVAELSITSEMDHVRNQARDVFHKYLMDYPLGKELEKHVSFYLSQTSFELQYGRESALAMLKTLIVTFPLKELNSFSGTILIILGARLVNEEVPQLRKTVAACLTTMLERLSNADRQPLFEIVLLWFSDKNINHRRLAAQLLGVFVNIEKVTFESRLPIIIPLILKQFGLDDTPGKFVKVKDANEDTSENEEKLRIKDHFYFQLLQLLLKICKHCPNFLKQKETINNLASHCQTLLNYPHDWVRLAACQFIGFVLSITDIGHLSNLLINGESDSSGYLSSDPHGSLKSLTLDLCDQLQPENLKTDLAEQVIKNLVFVARVLQNIPLKEEESDVMQINLLWLCKRLRKSVNMEVVQCSSSIVIRTEVFKWIAAITTVLEVDKLLPILHHLMAPLVREMLMIGEKNTFLRQLSKEVGNKIKKKIGLETYTETLNKLQQTLSAKRAERKRSRNQLAVVDPALHAQKKIKKQEKKKDSRKRKMVELKGKKNFKRRKVVDLEDF